MEPSRFLERGAEHGQSSHRGMNLLSSIFGGPEASSSRAVPMEVEYADDTSVAGANRRNIGREFKLKSKNIKKRTGKAKMELQLNNLNDYHEAAGYIYNNAPRPVTENYQPKGQTGPQPAQWKDFAKAYNQGNLDVAKVHRQSLLQQTHGTPNSYLVKMNNKIAELELHKSKVDGFKEKYNEELAKSEPAYDEEMSEANYKKREDFDKNVEKYKERVEQLDMAFAESEGERKRFKSKIRDLEGGIKVASLQEKHASEMNNKIFENNSKLYNQTNEHRVELNNKALQLKDNEIKSKDNQINLERQVNEHRVDLIMGSNEAINVMQQEKNKALLDQSNLVNTVLINNHVKFSDKLMQEKQQSQQEIAAAKDRSHETERQTLKEAGIQKDALYKNNLDFQKDTMGVVIGDVKQQAKSLVELNARSGQYIVDQTAKLLEDSKKEVKNLNDKMDKLQNEKIALMKESEEAKSGKKLSESEKESLVTRLKEVKDTEEKAKSDLEKANTELIRLKGDHSSASAVIKVHEESLKAKATEMEGLRSQLEEKRTHIEKLKGDIQSNDLTKKEHERLESAMIDDRNELIKLKTNIKNLELNETLAKKDYDSLKVNYFDAMASNSMGERKIEHQLEQFTKIGQLIKLTSAGDFGPDIKGARSLLDTIKTEKGTIADDGKEAIKKVMNLAEKGTSVRSILKDPKVLAMLGTLGGGVLITSITSVVGLIGIIISAIQKNQEYDLRQADKQKLEAQGISKDKEIEKLKDLQDKTMRERDILKVKKDT